MTTFVLVPGLWLDGTAWSATATELTRLGHTPVALTLPGQGDGRSDATYEDQVAAVVAAVDENVAGTDGHCIVVGHSAASTLAWVAADQRPGAVAKVVLVGGFPSADGERYADFFEPVDAAVPFPGWEPFEGPDAADLVPELRDRIAAGAHPVPEAVTRGVVRLSDEKRYDVPVLMVCPEYTPTEARAWVEAGDVPELARARRVEYVDLDSGHWPMFTQPAALAQVLAAAAAQEPTT